MNEQCGLLAIQILEKVLDLEKEDFQWVAFDIFPCLINSLDNESEVCSFLSPS